MTKAYVRNLLLPVLLATVLAGCGGGGSSSTNSDNDKVIVSGLVQKGLFTNLNVSAYPVDPVSGVVGAALPVEVKGQAYTIELDVNQILLFEAMGEFINDVNGSSVQLDEPLKVLVNIADKDVEANINILTTVVAEKTLKDIPNSSLTVPEIMAQQESFVNDLFGLPASTKPEKLSYKNINIDSDVTDPNLLLLLLSAGIVDVLEGDQFFADGFSEILNSAVAAATIGDAITVRETLNGLTINDIYSQVVDNAGYVFLPDIQLDNSPVLVCAIIVNTCEWISDEPTVTVTANAVYEAAGKAHFTIQLGRFSLLPVKIKIRTESGSATQGVDYIGLLSQDFVISPGSTSKKVELDIIIDGESEQAEELTILVESLSESYTVTTPSVTLLIRDGAPAGFENQDVSNMLIESVTVPLICLPSGDCSPIDSSKSLGLIEGGNILVKSEIDLAANCIDSANCPEQTIDWLVDYYLVAKNALDVRQAETALGSYIYKRATVQLASELANVQNPFINIGGNEIANLVQGASDNGWSLEVEARFGEPEINKVTSLPSIIPLPSSVIAGSSEITLGTVLSVADAGAAGCSQGEYSINAVYQDTANSIEIVAGINIAPAGTGGLCVQLDSSNPTSTPGVVVDGSIEIEDGVYKLGDGMGVRPVNQYTGINILIPALHSLFPSYLHAEGWPFEFLIKDVTLSSIGVAINYSGMKYVMDVGYSDQDPRKNGQLYSNDIFYSGVSGQTGSLLITPDGLDGAITLAQNNSNTKSLAFPKAKVQWQSFTQEIKQNKLQPTQLNISSYEMQQATACTAPGCDGNAPQTWQIEASNTKLDGDGFLLGDGVNQSADQVVVFGAKGNGAFAWSRPDDLVLQQNLKLAIPGYAIPAVGRVSDYLLAHLDDTPVDADLSRYPMGSLNFNDGNFHPVGLSVGPETYRNAQGVPETGDGQNLSAFDNRLTINNGVDIPFNLTSSVAVKYVLRNAGLTGVFNVAASSLDSNAQFYGYPLSLSRFAVRATDNTLDTFTWIDGRLALQGEAGGPDGLDIWFENLEINCAARLANVDLLFEQCDGIDNNGNGIIDENCLPRLYSWQTETDIFAAGFSGAENALACATGNQSFTLEQQLYFEALNKPVVFQTQWDALGNLATHTSGELPSYRFDKSNEGEGFPIKTSGAKLASGQVDNVGYGWLEFSNTRLGVPFWDGLKADLRLANRQKFAELVAEPTVVLPAGQLAVQQTSTTQTNKQLLQKTIDDEIFIDAQYQWGNTGFGFTLPVYYQPYQLDSGQNDADANGSQSRFVGHMLSKDLFVMDANAGINFIEPERTKLSFGASADFEKLGNISFQVDPTDPDSSKAVDDLLISLNIISDPLLEPALTDFLDSVNVINRFASRGLDEAVQKGLELAVKKAGQAVAPVDPFVIASEGLALVRSGPQQVITIISDEIKQPLNNQLFALEQQVRDEIDLLKNPQISKEDVLSQIDTVIIALKQVKQRAETIDVGVGYTVDRAQGLLADVQPILIEIETATIQIDNIMLETVTFVESSCNSGFVSSSESKGYLDKTIERFTAVRDLASTIKNSEALFLIAEQLAVDTEQKNRLDTSKRRVREAVGELLGFVDDADQAIRNAVCSSDINEVLLGVTTLLDRVRDDVNVANTALANASAAINDLHDVNDKLVLMIVDPIDQFVGALESARGKVDTNIILANEVIDNIDSLLIGNNGIDGLLEGVFDTARDDITEVISDVEVTLVASLDGLLPGAYMTPQQLREMLVTEVMRSAPIKLMRLKMDKHFSEIGYSVNGIVLQYLDQLNLVIQSALASINGPVNEALSAATSVVRKIPLKSAGIDGYAIIAGNELERAHIGAEWSMRGGDDDNPTTYRAALDAESWSVRNLSDDLETSTACSVGDASSLLDVKISAYGLPINILESNIELEKLYLGFTLQQGGPNEPPLIPIGIFGGINTMGSISFTDASVIDPAFAAGLGKLQTYVGASAAASFSSLEAEVAFLVGRVCPGNTALTDLDPDVEKFLPSMPPSGFTGAYLRGGATIPLVPGGCALNLSVSADFGTWIFVGQPTTVGGLVGGGAVGEVLCIAAIKGKVRVAGSVNTDGGLKLGGEAWGVAGAGFCEPETWTNVKRSRNDDWCGTGDIETNAIFENGEWDIDVPTPRAIF